MTSFPVWRKLANIKFFAKMYEHLMFDGFITYKQNHKPLILIMIKDIGCEKLWFHFFLIRNHCFFCMNSKILIHLICIDTLHLFQQKLYLLKLQVLYFLSEGIHRIEFLSWVWLSVTFNDGPFSFLWWQQFFKRRLYLPLHFLYVGPIFILQLHAQLRSGMLALSWSN